MLDKRCGLCGDEMACLDCGGGSVWSCAQHGVRDWLFAGQGAGAPPRAQAKGLSEAALQAAARTAATRVARQ